MQVGDLVKKRPEWGDWTKHNPWMYTKKDFEIGMIIGTRHLRDDKSYARSKKPMEVFHVLIGGKKVWYAKNELELVSEAR